MSRILMVGGHTHHRELNKLMGSNGGGYSLPSMVKVNVLYFVGYKNECGHNLVINIVFLLG
jgi:hypothetical protein